MIAGRAAAMLVGMCVAPSLVLTLVLPLVQSAAPSAADPVVDDDALLDRIEAHCEDLRQRNELRTVDSLREHADGRRCALAPAEPAAAPLRRAALAERLQRSTVIVGCYFPCAECKGWHFSASTGFWVGRDGAVATCFHLLAADPSAPGGLLAVADWQGTVWPVTGVLAGDAAADVAVLQCPAKEREPLPLRADLAPTGEAVFCLSNPDHQFATFSEGMVSRRYRVREAAPGAAPERAPKPGEHRPPAGAPRPLTMLQVTCEFAVGSSGAPITDAAGNVVGIAQSTATVYFDPDAEPADPQMVARTAVPVLALRALLRP